MFHFGGISRRGGGGSVPFRRDWDGWRLEGAGNGSIARVIVFLGGGGGLLAEFGKADVRIGIIVQVFVQFPEVDEDLITVKIRSGLTHVVDDVGVEKEGEADFLGDREHKPVPFRPLALT